MRVVVQSLEVCQRALVTVEDMVVVVASGVETRAINRRICPSTAVRAKGSLYLSHNKHSSSNRTTINGRCSTIANKRQWIGTEAEWTRT